MSTARLPRTARFTTIGKISKTRGAGGEFFIARPETVASDLLVGATVFLVPPGSRDGGRQVEVATDTGDGLSLKVAGIDSRAAAFDYVGRTVIVSSGVVGAMPDVLEEFIDRVGYVVSEGPLELGTVVAIMETAAHPVVVIQGSSGEILIPGVPEFVTAIDDDQRTIEVRTIPGMVPERVGE